VPDDLDRMQRARRIAGRVMRSTHPLLAWRDLEGRCPASPLARLQIATTPTLGPGERMSRGGPRRVQKEGTSVQISARV
jgi:hypothetical protein